MTRRARFGLLAAVLVVAAVCVNLGLWQGRRLAARKAANAEALARRELPVLDLARAADSSGLDQRRVRFSGDYDHGRTLVLRGRVEREAPGVQLVTPLRLDGTDRWVLVNRGFVPADDAVRPNPLAVSRPERTTVTGIAFDLPESEDRGGPLTALGTSTWRRLDRHGVADSLPYPVLPVWVQALTEERPEGSPPFPLAVAPRPLDDGPHLAYMLQWFGIAAAALAFGVLVLRGGHGRGRRDPAGG